MSKIIYLLSFIASLLFATSLSAPNNPRLRIGNDGQPTRKLVCYYESLAIYRPPNGTLEADQIDPFLCTHLIYRSIKFNDQNQVRSSFPRVDLANNGGRGQLNKFVGLKKLNPKLKTLVSITEDSRLFSNMSAEPETRSMFAKSVLDFLNSFDLDGVELVWKYPNDHRGQQADKQNYVELLRELRAQLGPEGKLLAIAAPVGARRVQAGLDVGQASAEVDMINLMSYDYNGGWDNQTGLHAPLFSSPTYDLSPADAALNVNWSINYWLQQGAPAEKLLIGVTGYSRSFQLEDPAQTGLRAPSAGPGLEGPHTKDNRLLAYSELCNMFKREPELWTLVRDQDYQSAYVYSGRQWLSLEDVDSVSLKAQYARSMGLGGIAFNSLDMDDFLGQCHKETYPLTRAANRALDIGADTAEPQPVGVTEPAAAVDYEPSSPAPPQQPAITKPPPPPPMVVTLSPLISGELPRVPGNQQWGQGGPTSPPQVALPVQVPKCGSNGMWYFPGPTCRDYYDCTSGQPLLKTCRDSLVWKQSNLWCDYPHNVPECQR